MVRAVVVIPLMGLLLGQVTLSTADAASLWLENGERIDGNVVGIIGEAVTVRRSIGGLQVLSLNDLERIDVKTPDGTVSGRLTGFRDGGLEILTADGATLLVDNDGRLIERAEAAPTPGMTGQDAPDPSSPRMIEAADDQVVVTMSDGSTIEGRITSASRRMFTLRSTDGRLRPAMRGNIDKVAFTSEDGSEIEGSILDWANGATAVTLTDGTIAVGLTPDGRRDQARLDAFLATLSGEDAEEAMTSAASTAGNGSNEPAETATDPDMLRQTASLEEAPAEPVSTDPGLVTIDIASSAASVIENAGEVEISFEMKGENGQSVSVFYTTLIGTATSNVDYESKQGRISLDGDTPSARVGIPLIDDDISEETEHFVVFFSTDPNRAALSTKRLRIDVEDDD